MIWGRTAWSRFRRRSVNAQFPARPEVSIARSAPAAPAWSWSRQRRRRIQYGGTVLYDAVFLASDEVLKPATGPQSDHPDHGWSGPGQPGDACRARWKFPSVPT